MEFTPQFMVQVLIGLGAGVGAYAAIRYDLGRLHERTEQAINEAIRANQRMDAIMQVKR